MRKIISNRLKLDQKIAIVSYLKANKTAIAAGDMIRVDVCLALTKLLGQTITPAHLTAPIEIAGVKFRKGWGGSKQIREFDRSAIATLTAGLSDLYIRLGQKMPDKLAELKEALASELSVQNSKGN